MVYNFCVWTYFQQSCFIFHPETNAFWVFEVSVLPSFSPVQILSGKLVMWRSKDHKSPFWAQIVANTFSFQTAIPIPMAAIPDVRLESNLVRVWIREISMSVQDQCQWYQTDPDFDCWSCLNISQSRISCSLLLLKFPRVYCFLQENRFIN